MKITEEQIEAGARAICKAWAESSRYNEDEMWKRFESYFLIYSKVCLEATWKAWWEGVARRSIENEGNNHAA